MKYTCKDCGKVFDNKQSFAGHRSGHARITKNFNPVIHSKCSYCGLPVSKKQNKKYSNIYCSKEHMYKHRKEIRDKEPVKIGRVVMNNITKGEMDQYLKEHTVCEICGREEYITTNGPETNNLCMDHNHETNNFRGLLCNRCNTALGYWETYGDKIIQYLENNYETKHVSMV